MNYRFLLQLLFLAPLFAADVPPRENPKKPDQQEKPKNEEPDCVVMEYHLSCGELMTIAAAGALGGPIALQAILAAAGFGTAGVAAGSFAAWWQSVVYGAHTGGAFAFAQAAGAGGLGAAGAAGAATLGSAAAVSACYSKLKWCIHDMSQDWLGETTTQDLTNLTQAASETLSKVVEKMKEWAESGTDKAKESIDPKKLKAMQDLVNAAGEWTEQMSSSTLKFFHKMHEAGINFIGKENLAKAREWMASSFEKLKELGDKIHEAIGKENIDKVKEFAEKTKDLAKKTTRVAVGVVDEAIKGGFKTAASIWERAKAAWDSGSAKKSNDDEKRANAPL